MTTAATPPVATASAALLQLPQVTNSVDGCVAGDGVMPVVNLFMVVMMMMVLIR